jgi:elongator complex protein 2
MPSLGLSNKATADTDMESSRFSGPVDDNDLARTLDPVEELRLPSERDLGVTTLWPETGKLFGHESELICLVSYRAPAGTGESSLVASSCMARNDVASAAIRLWDAKKGKCVGVLKVRDVSIDCSMLSLLSDILRSDVPHHITQGGHRSTVSTMSFSRDGKYLVS